MHKKAPINSDIRKRDKVRGLIDKALVASTIRGESKEMPTRVSRDDVLRDDLEAGGAG